MDASIPGLYRDGSRLVWCPLEGRGDLESAPQDGLEVQRFVSKRPEWNEEVGSLVLDFKGGTAIKASSRNFQLALSQKPDHVLCQFGKTGSRKFALNVRFPMSIVQAFAVSITTSFWR
mmetsp:Transcript_30241/g.66080  ORF Transcript_30241/g.66080 Transcript_30241/m.66080 type:complete len:118 (+) Transcript_30241:1-354(+)